VKSDINLEDISKPRRRKILDNILTDENQDQILMDASISDNDDAYSTDLDPQDALESPLVIVNTDFFK
jgi:hypothetical protein